MKNIFQSVLDQANEKRRNIIEHGHQASPRLVRQVREYKHQLELKSVEKLGNVKIIGDKKHER